MKKTVSLLASIFFLLGAAVAFAADFTADMTISTRGGNEAKGKIYTQGNKMRMEMKGSGDENAITISRPDRKLVWILMPEEKMYMEQPYREDPKMKEWTPSQEAQSKFIGDETVSGMACKKYQVQGKEIFYWISEKIRFPVKTQDPEGTMLLKNIQLGNVPGNLFEVPPGFEKFSMPAMVPGGMPGTVPPNMPGMVPPGNPRGR